MVVGEGFLSGSFDCIWLKRNVSKYLSSLTYILYFSFVVFIGGGGGGGGGSSGGGYGQHSAGGGGSTGYGGSQGGCATNILRWGQPVEQNFESLTLTMLNATRCTIWTIPSRSTWHGIGVLVLD